MTGGEPRWRWLSTREIHRGGMRIDVDEVELPDGERRAVEVDRSVSHAAAALVVVDGDVLLARRYRYAVDRTVVGLAGGPARPGESPEQTARRGVEEALGVVAERLIPLHRYFPDPEFRVWPVHLFLVDAVRSGPGHAAGRAERRRAPRLPLAELDRLLAEGEIVDPALLIARTMAAAQGLLPPIG